MALAALHEDLLRNDRAEAVKLIALIKGRFAKQVVRCLVGSTDNCSAEVSNAVKGLRKWALACRTIHQPVGRARR